MWCSTCQQDTPGVPNATSGRTVCSRCQQPMQKQQATYATRICDDGLALDEPLEAQTSSPRSPAAPFRTDDWAAQKRLRSAVRELRRPNPTTGTAPNRAVFSERRLDPPQDLFAQIENATTPTLSTYAPASFTGDAAPKHNTSGQVAAWLVVIAGVVTLAAGLGLIGWSLSTDQMLYWNYAIGLAMAGQGALIFGLVLVISRLWRNSRYSADKLQDVHTRLGQLQQSSETLAATRGGSAPAFYADLVRGANPHMMLANIKGQVDQLATRVSTAW